ncbi:hypothetical protein MBH78_05210 [Oceanimonas sp. NS1]|nr:hypothetical protein [Oceanimonas sp. NS1]
MALTWSSDDRQQMLAFHGKIQQDFGALGYQQGYRAESFGGDTHASLGLSGAGRLNEQVILIGELSWDLLSDSRYGDQIYSDEAWLGVRIRNELELTVGRSDSPFNQLRDLTDVFNLFGGHGYMATSTLDDQVKLTWASDGWDVRAGYAANDADRQDGNSGSNPSMVPRPAIRRTTAWALCWRRKISTRGRPTAIFATWHWA